PRRFRLAVADEEDLDRTGRAREAQLAVLARCRRHLPRPRQRVTAGPPPPATIVSARAARTALRTSVDAPTGVVWSWPKQRQSGRRPCPRLATTPAAKAASRMRAPVAATVAVLAAMRPAATASSAAGKRTLPGPAAL